MALKPIYITDYDLERLTDLLEAVKRGSHRGQTHLAKLQDELERAVIVAPEDVPADVITMNSTISMIDLSTKKEETFTLVYPEKSNLEKGRISILTAIGTAIIGYRVGDVIEWDFPSGKRALKITKILYQPEAAGNFDL